MRKKTLLIGLFLFLVGVFLMYGGTGLLNALATTSVNTENEKPVLLTVDGNSFSYLSKNVSLVNLRSLKIGYAATGDINFYVMDEVEFDAWTEGRETPVEFSVFSASKGNLTLGPEHEGTYYFVFDNRASDNLKSVMFSLSWDMVVSELDPTVRYIPQVLMIIGVVMAMLGLGGKKKPKPKPKPKT